jgi:hypothetical protein
MSCNVEVRMIPRCRALNGVLGLTAIAGLMTSSFIGCGGSSYAIPTVHPVKGQVLLPDGKPLTSGSVVLVSNQDVEFPGKLESDGRFSIQTPAGEGAPAGEYKVRIDPEPRTGSAGRSHKSTANLPFPAKYTDDSTSDLKVTVKPGENNLEAFKLVPGPARSTTGKGSTR